MAPNSSIPRKLPILIVTKEVLFPGASMRLSVNSTRNINMIRNRLSQNTLASTIIGVVPKEPGSEIDTADDLGMLHPIGTAAMVVQVTSTNWPATNYTILVTGICRFRLEKIVMEVPYVVGVVTQLDKFNVNEVNDENPGLNELIKNFRNEAAKLVELSDISLPVVGRVRNLLESIPGQHLADVCSALLKASYEEKLELLDALDLTDRFQKALQLLIRQVEIMQEKKNNHSFIIKRRMIKPGDNVGAVSKNLDENASETDEIHELQAKLRNAGLPPQARKVAFKELQRLKRLSPFSPEDGIIRSYIELMAELPWSRSSQETIDIQKARKDLDADHYAMEKLKKRVLEYLAVRQLKNSLRGPILCFVGPPGVGKTSVGRSIAHTLGREFHRISLGGVCNQADIRGHRRTYIGSMPGRIIQGLKTAGVNNPVFLLDEVDKMCAGIHGDPAAALLEVLDPEQNCNFVDHYLNVPFDLSQVMFIATANTLDSIPAPLLDRMEVIRVPGYTHEEKLHIAKLHLLPKQLEEHGLDKSMVTLSEESIKILITKYTREAGVRTLERKLGAICRAVAVKVAEWNSSSTGNDAKKETVMPPVILDEAALEDILGEAGVAVGLAWTSVGGEVLLVEATQVEGDGEVMLTGQLGDVMKESARLALNWVRTHARQYGFGLENIGGDPMSNADVHIHFPAGAVVKDGPSAGITIVVALVSLFSGRPMARETAMTGELTLHGEVLPVGGVKEKVLAAHRAGLKKIILPKKCEKVLVEIPDYIKKDLAFILVSNVDEVLQAAFDGGWKL
ncbi:hypothetical protein J437_LFUL003367, partial [Ladona fulva]